MRCLFCGAEWKVRLSNKNIIDSCPFCNRELFDISNKSSSQSLSDVFRVIVNLYGKEIMTNGQRVTALISDLAPVLQKEKRVVIAMSYCKGNELIYEMRLRPRTEYLVARDRICSQMEQEWGISTANSKLVCDCLWDALHDSDNSDCGRSDFPFTENYASPSIDLSNSVSEMDSEDCYMLGRAYEGLPDTKPNIAKALYWFERSANRGYAEAQVKIAEYYYHGIGTQVDKLSSVYWLEQATVQGNCHAQVTLAKMYATGDGIKKNDSLAASLFELAANQGNLEAQIRIAQYYKDGVGVSKSSEEAIKWLETASKQGSKEAIYKLALMYDYGDGVARDAAKATQLYKDYYLDS